MVIEFGSTLMGHGKGPRKRIFDNFSFVNSVDPTLWARISRFSGQQNPCERLGSAGRTKNRGKIRARLPRILPTEFVVVVGT